MPSNSPQQTQQSQQGNQTQALQELMQMQQRNSQLWDNFFQQFPNPAQGWSGIAAPSMAGQPAGIGGGHIGGNGKLTGAFGGWSPSGPSAPMLPAPPPSNPPAKNPPFPKTKSS